MAEQEKLSEQQVNQVLNAFDYLAFSKGYRQALYNDFLTPDMVNSAMQDVNMNPQGVTLSELQEALSNPKDSEELLCNYATYAESSNMYYKRLARFLPDMAAFHLGFDCYNAREDKDYNSKEFKEDLLVMDDFCSKFNYKEEFQKVFRQLMRQGVFYGVLRKDKNKYTLQELPAQFCKITGRSAYGLLFDFNMEWFIGNYGTDIRMYPDSMKKMYRKTINSTGLNYNPAKDIDKRNTTYVYWCQCSPEDGFWCFKMSPEIATVVPYFAPLFPNISYAPVVRGLQYDKYFIQASKLLVGEIGFLENTKSGQVANQVNMTPDVIGKFIGAARKGLAKQIQMVALPLQDIQSVDFDVDDTNIETDSNTSMASQSISSYQAMFSTEKLNTHQSKLAAAIDANIIGATYPIFADFIEYFVNLETKKYKFKITFSDYNMPDDQERVNNLAKDYMALGVTDVQTIARALDVGPFELQRRLKLTKMMGFQEDLIMPLNVYTQSNETNLENDKANKSEATGENNGGQVGRPRGSQNENHDNNDGYDHGTYEGE